MSQDSGDLVTNSPTASSTERAVLQDEGDIQILTGSHTKEELKKIALTRLTELRTEKASLQRDKDNALSQITELRRLIYGEQHTNSEEVNEQYTTTTNVTSSQPAPLVHQSSVNYQLPIKRQLTKPALPDKFNGVDKTLVISNWLFSMRLYLRVTRTDVEDYVMMATTFFTGTALDWWQGVERVEGEDVYNWSWETFEGRCKRRFQATNDAQLAFQRLLRWKQTGHIAAYLSVFQSLIQQIPLTLLTEQGRVFMLIEGLNHELQKAVRLMQPTTVDEAINVAERASVTFHPSSQFHQPFNRSINRQASTTTRTSSQFNRAATGSRFAPLIVENVEEVYPEGQYDSPQYPNYRGSQPQEADLTYLNAEQRKLYKEKRCFHCKKVGHWSRECRYNLNTTKE